MAAATGWFPDDIWNRLTVPQLVAMYAQWAKYPPVHVSVAIYMGFGKETAKLADPNVGEMISFLGAQAVSA